MTDLIVAGTLAGPAGNIDLMEPGVTQLEASTLDSRQVTHRKIEAPSAFAEGSYVVRSLRENVVENISVFVRGADHLALQAKVDEITAAFDQRYYSLVMQVEDKVMTWLCMTADYTIETSQPFQVSTLALIKAQVPRLPRVQISASV